ncbi:MAG: hypothetical protein CMI02_01695 [Oceanospirillaceae bacterium]|nr:hypothetical protein [Oceanospirillaceae bacterium]MBT10733.1 hypothetical protein [Oceanospirillaceae bacterium]|tara:strand:+ start:56110 stop:56571 length:462 start_codon:yes stop_codon:yes gene_type:complete
MRTLLLALMLLPSFVMAEVTLKTEAFKIVAVQQSDGTAIEEWQAADKIVPGDKVGFRISYANQGEEAAEGIVINNPVPADAEYVANTATGRNTRITYSVDGGETFATASALTVTENGASRPAKAGDYTNIRWTLNTPVEAGDSGKVEYKVRIK